MDNKLMIQLLLNKTGEIQSLLEHFKNQPHDLENGLTLLSDRINGLGKEFEILKEGFASSPQVQTETILVTAEPQEIKKEPVAEVKKVQIKEPEEEVKVVEVKEPAPVVVEAKEVTEDSHTNGEINHVESSILNDQLQSSSSGVIGEQLSTHKLEDIQSAIGINDRFLFIRELFNNNTEEYNSAIQFVNQSENFGKVEHWIKEKQQWDTEDPAVNQFIEIVKRKF